MLTQIEERLEVLSTFCFGSIVEYESDGARLNSNSNLVTRLGGTLIHAYPTLWATDKSLHHPLLCGRAVVQPGLSGVKKRLELIRCEDGQATEDSATLGVELENELSDDTKVRACATNAPKEICVLFLVGS